MKIALFAASLLVALPVLSQPVSATGQGGSGPPALLHKSCQLLAALMKQAARLDPDFFYREPFIFRIKVKVEVSGEASDVKVLGKVLHPSLERTAHKEMQRCRFSPATEDGKAVAREAILELRADDRFIVKNFATCPFPTYPLEAARAGREGFSRIRVHINEEGLPVRTEVIESSGTAELDAAAMSAMMGCRPLPQRPPDQSFDVGHNWHL